MPRRNSWATRPKSPGELTHEHPPPGPSQAPTHRVEDRADAVDRDVDAGRCGLDPGAKFARVDQETSTQLFQQGDLAGVVVVAAPSAAWVATRMPDAQTATGTGDQHRLTGPDSRDVAGWRWSSRPPCTRRCRPPPALWFAGMARGCPPRRDEPGAATVEADVPEELQRRGTASPGSVRHQRQEPQHAAPLGETTTPPAGGRTRRARPRRSRPRSVAADDRQPRSRA